MISFCNSRSCEIQFSRSFCASWLPCLYIQWAATPYSATSCMRRERICTSIGWPLWLITVVCSDWYPFGLGTAM